MRTASAARCSSPRRPAAGRRHGRCWSCDADLVVFDPEKRHLITAAKQESKTDYNLYEGTEVVGDVETVLLRGNVIVDGGEVLGKPGVGRFVARARFGEQLRAEVEVA